MRESESQPPHPSPCTRSTARPWCGHLPAHDRQARPGPSSALRPGPRSSRKQLRCMRALQRCAFRNIPIGCSLSGVTTQRDLERRRPICAVRCEVLFADAPRGNATDDEDGVCGSGVQRLVSRRSLRRSRRSVRPLRREVRDGVPNPSAAPSADRHGRSGIWSNIHQRGVPKSMPGPVGTVSGATRSSRKAERSNGGALIGMASQRW